MEELADVRAKWYNIGLGLGLGVGTLNCIKIEHSDTSDCLRETLMIWMKSYPPPPTWSKVVDALRTKTVGEVRLAADLEQKYCTTQDIAASHQHTPPVQAVLPSQAHTQTTSLPQFTVPLTQPPVIITSPQSVPPQPYPSHSPPWSVPYTIAPTHCLLHQPATPCPHHLEKLELTPLFLLTHNSLKLHLTLLHLSH